MLYVLSWQQAHVMLQSCISYPRESVPLLHAILLDNFQQHTTLLMALKGYWLISWVCHCVYRITWSPQHGVRYCYHWWETLTMFLDKLSLCCQLFLWPVYWITSPSCPAPHCCRICVFTTNSHTHPGNTAICIRILCLFCVSSFQIQMLQ